MAYLNPPFRLRPPAVAAEQPSLFQRGIEKVPVKKLQRTLIVRPRHIALFFLLVAAVFLGFARGYLFLITTSEFNVRTTRVVASRDFVAADVRALADPSRLGNLLAVDIGNLKSLIESHPWVRQARLRKIFPSELRVEITEREPAAVLKSGDDCFVVAEDGVVLGRSASAEDLGLPVLVDAGNFQDLYHEKLALAWECLKLLTADETSAIEALDVSRLDSPGLFIKGLPTRIILGRERFSEKLREYLSNREAWESEEGPLEYVDLRFDDRVYLKPLPALEVAALNLPKQEAE